MLALFVVAVLTLAMVLTTMEHIPARWYRALVTMMLILAMLGFLLALQCVGILPRWVDHVDWGIWGD